MTRSASVATDAARYAEVVAALRAMSEPDVLRIHREVGRLAAPIYARVYRNEWEAGSNAARSRAQREAAA